MDSVLRATDENFWAYERAGLTMYGQMTAAGWFYIGTQGILGFTYETFAAICAGCCHWVLVTESAAR